MTFRRIPIAVLVLAALLGPLLASCGDGEDSDVISPSAVTDLSALSLTTSSVLLTWTAPGDDGNTASATEYDVRYSTSTITESNWASSSQAMGEPTPKPVGGPENWTVTNLAANTTYFFALKSRDEVADHYSQLSNVATVITNPIPWAVVDLAASSTATAVSLTWTAPSAGDNVGALTEYDVRYSLVAITEGNWASASQAMGEPTPKAAGGSETFTVPGLSSNPTTYFFALKTRDEVMDHYSQLSNVVTATTNPPPAAVMYLQTYSPTVSSVALAWIAPGADDNTGTATEYDLRYSMETITEVNWSSASQAIGEPTPQAAGESDRVTVSGLHCDVTYYFGLKTRDEIAGHWSAISNPSSANTSACATGDGIVLLPIGTFTMGSPEGELGRDSDEKQHIVTLTKAFYISSTEVTQADWLAVMGWNDSHFTGDLNRPVEGVTWYDAADFCNKKSTADGFTQAYSITNVTKDGNHLTSATVSWNLSADGYRLPTEAEWEYACRAGTQTAFANGIIKDQSCSDPNLDLIGWYCGDQAGTRAVKGKIPNTSGLYDMHGNVWEYCWDWYGTYPGTVTDYTGPSFGGGRVIRGGGWLAAAHYCRSADRITFNPYSRDFSSIGIRLARTAS